MERTAGGRVDRPPQGFHGHLRESRWSLKGVFEMSKKKGAGGCFSAQRKQEAELRPLRGEDLETMSGELGVTTGTVSQEREQFLTAGQVALHSCQPVLTWCWPGGARSARDDRLAQPPASTSRCSTAKLCSLFARRPERKAVA